MGKWHVIYEWAPGGNTENFNDGGLVIIATDIPRSIIDQAALEHTDVREFRFPASDAYTIKEISRVAFIRRNSNNPDTDFVAQLEKETQTAQAVADMINEATQQVLDAVPEPEGFA